MPTLWNTERHLSVPHVGLQYSNPATKVFNSSGWNILLCAEAITPKNAVVGIRNCEQTNSTHFVYVIKLHAFEIGI